MSTLVYAKHARKVFGIFVKHTTGGTINKVVRSPASENNEFKFQNLKNLITQIIKKKEK